MVVVEIDAVAAQEIRLKGYLPEIIDGHGGQQGEVVESRSAVGRRLALARDLPEIRRNPVAPEEAGVVGAADIGAGEHGGKYHLSRVVQGHAIIGVCNTRLQAGESGRAIGRGLAGAGDNRQRCTVGAEDTVGRRRGAWENHISERDLSGVIQCRRAPIRVKLAAAIGQRLALIGHHRQSCSIAAVDAVPPVKRHLAGVVERRTSKSREPARTDASDLRERRSVAAKDPCVISRAGERGVEGHLSRTVEGRAGEGVEPAIAIGWSWPWRTIWVTTPEALSARKRPVLLVVPISGP